MALGAETSSYEIPKSRGIPPVVRWFAVVGLILIVFMGAISIVGAGTNHYWPAEDTPKIPLSGSLV
jgi:hypothetical protein